MRAYDVKVDNTWVGPLRLVKITPYEKDGVKIGFKCHTYMEEHDGEKLIVKIPGEPNIELHGKAIDIEFTDLFVRPYFYEERFGLTATASNVKPVSRTESGGK